MDLLIDFVEKSNYFEPVDKLKLVLFAANQKHSTFVALKITPKNIGDKFHFEKHLRDHSILFNVSKAKSFEEIHKISSNKIMWSLEGTWYGYDLFRNKKYQQLFKRYKSVVKRQNKDKADILAGQIYNYPACCVKQYIKENNLDWLKKQYSYYKYYKKLQEAERKFPFIVHFACSKNCKESRQRNTKYQNIVKKRAKKFFKEFSKKKFFKTDFIVEGENNIVINIKEYPLWTEKDGHEYNLVSKKPYDCHHYMFSYLTNKKDYIKGSLLSGSVTMRYNYADVKIRKLKKVIPNLIHVRKFNLLGRKY